MKKIVFCLLLLTFSFRLAAQIDYLEPVKPFSTYTGELGEYYRSVFSLLNTGFQKQPYARFAAIPSFSSLLNRLPRVGACGTDVDPFGPIQSLCPTFGKGP